MRHTKILIVITTVGMTLAAIALMFSTVWNSRRDGSAPYTSAAPPPPAPASPLAAIDRMLESLELANIAFNTPATLQLGDASIIQLLLSTQETMEELQGMLHTMGEKTGARIRVSNEMEARLTGQGFKIEAITPEAQAVSGTERTEWKWEVHPTAGGVQRLHLTLSALLYVEGHKTLRAIRTFERMIEIRVSWPRKTSDFVANNWQWLWTTLLVPVGGWIVRKRWGWGESKGKPGSA